MELRDDGCESNQELSNSVSHNADGSCKNCTLRCKSLFCDLPDPEVDLLDLDKTTARYEAGDIIFKEGHEPEGLICLKSGKVKITKVGNFGAEQIIDLKKPVDFISLKALMSGKVYSSSAVALEASEVCIIKKEPFFIVLANNPDFSMKLIRFFAAKLEENENRTLVLTTKHMRARLAEALLFLYEVYGMSKNNTLNVELKRAELAALTNMIPSNATRTLSDFTKEKLIATNKRKISLLDLEGLKEISQYGHVLRSKKKHRKR